MNAIDDLMRVTLTISEIVSQFLSLSESDTTDISVELLQRMVVFLQEKMDFQVLASILLLNKNKVLLRCIFQDE